MDIREWVPVTILWKIITGSKNDNKVFSDVQRIHVMTQAHACKAELIVQGIEMQSL